MKLAKRANSNYELLPCLSQFLHKLRVSVESVVGGRFVNFVNDKGWLNITDVDHLMQSRRSMKRMNIPLYRNDSFSLTRNDGSPWYPCHISIFRPSSKTSTSISWIRSGPPEPFSIINFNGRMKSTKGLDLTASWIQTWRMNQTWSKCLSDVWLALFCTSCLKHES